MADGHLQCGPLLHASAAGAPLETYRAAGLTPSAISASLMVMADG